MACSEGEGLVCLDLTVTVCCRALELQPEHGLRFSKADLVIPLPGLFTGAVAGCRRGDGAFRRLCLAQQARVTTGQDEEDAAPFLSIPGDRLANSQHHPVSATGRAVIEADLAAIAQLLQSRQHALLALLTERSVRLPDLSSYLLAPNLHHLNLLWLQVQWAALRCSRYLIASSAHQQQP